MPISVTAPWGVRRLALYPNTVQVPYPRKELDQETQTTRYLDADGKRINMGDHGTGTTTAEQTKTAPSDGGDPKNPPPSDSDLVEGVDSD